jgi:carboxylesterase
MTPPSPPVPDPFDYAGSQVGVLLIHGFTGSPAEMRPLGQYLAERGHTVVGPLLPGHGTTWQDLSTRKWPEWTEAVERAYQALRQRCRTVFVGGGSMGGLLTLYLAERQSEIAGIFPMAPALYVADWRAHLAGLFKHVIKTKTYDPGRDGDDLTDPQARQTYLWSYTKTPLAAVEQLLRLQGQVRRHLSQVTMPTLILQGMHDRSVKPSTARYAYEQITSKDKELIWLHDSGHCLWVDSEREQVWHTIQQFITHGA